MVRGCYLEAIKQLELYQNTLYKGTRNEDLGEIARAVFCDAPLDAPALEDALNAMENSQLRPVARANAYIGALVAKNWTMENAAKQLSAILNGDPRLIEQIGMDTTLRLL